MRGKGLMIMDMQEKFCRSFTLSGGNTNYLDQLVGNICRDITKAFDEDISVYNVSFNGHGDTVTKIDALLKEPLRNLSFFYSSKVLINFSSVPS